MSPPTFDLQKMRERALEKQNRTSSISRWLASWWTRKYKRPANDVRFRSQSPGALLREMLADHVKQRDEILELLRTNEGDRPALLEQLAAVEGLLGIRPDDDTPIVTGDPIVDAWEREIAEGRLPESLAKGIVQPRPGALPFSPE